MSDHDLMYSHAHGPTTLPYASHVFSANDYITAMLAMRFSVCVGITLFVAVSQ